MDRAISRSRKKSGISKNSLRQSSTGSCVLAVHRPLSMPMARGKWLMLARSCSSHGTCPGIHQDVQPVLNGGTVAALGKEAGARRVVGAPAMIADLALVDVLHFLAAFEGT
jgi:hypothetical protein